MGVADMTRISNRASTIAAAFSIVLLVIFLVILWTGVRTAKQEAIERVVGGRIDPATEKFNGIFEERDNESSSTTVRIVYDESGFSNEVIPREEEPSKKPDKSTNGGSSSANPDLEYVDLMKISENQYDDPPDESSAVQTDGSGHFRHSKAEIWDSHPQYEFTAFGRHFRLRLAHDSSFISPNIKITHMSENTVRREHPGPELGCFYSGTVDDDPHSSVTVSLCHGMTGHVRTSTGSYIIKPTKPWPKNDKDSLEFSLQHSIQRIRSTHANAEPRSYIDEQAKAQGCGVIDESKPTPALDDVSDGKIYVDARRRERRSLTERNKPIRSREDEEDEQFFDEGADRRNLLRNDHRYERYYSVERRQNNPSEEYGQDSEMESDPFVTWRPRRALPREYFIQIMVAADAEMVKYHGPNLFNYILVLMSTVSRIYKHQSIGNPINISVMKIVPIHKVFASNGSNYDDKGIAATRMLNEFCHWQQSINPREPSPLHHDAALLLTRANLCHDSAQKTCDTLGLAELGRMCSPGNSCAIVQDNGLAAAFTIAHEIGHVLNMPHDDDDKCSSYENSGILNIMSRMLDDDTFPWEWSDCSRYYVTEFLEAGHGSCLLNEPAKTMEREDETRLPGEDYSVNRQCELVFDRGYRICTLMPHDVCKKLWCTASKWNDSDQCHTQHMPWADGTPCDKDKWCHQGKCVSRTNLEPVDGQWGEWGRYGECSRTCGGGVKKKIRECNNPSPQNGGKYCVGDRVKYRSCSTRECPPGSIDFRELQCSKHNGNNHSKPNVTENVVWHAAYSQILPQDRCKLICEVDSSQSYKLEDKVVDGTPCGRDTFHVCVNGHCRPAGCDHVLNSTAELDICGVCRGDNSTCQWITGSYNSTKYGYTRITTIPAGSNNIDIRQHSYGDMQNDHNYLALRLTNGSYILNGNFVVMIEKEISVSGVPMDYSGSKAIERLNTSRPIDTDIILEVLSVKELNPPQITYKFTVPKRILKNYTWVSDWTECSHACQGVKYRRAECRNIGNKDVVSDDYCSDFEKPREFKQTCNTHCALEWKITSASECSSHCGPGNRTVTSACVQKLLNSIHSARRVSEHACAHLPRPNDTEFCMGPCENVHWSYGEWSACSATCGGGVQYRTAKCVDWSSREVAEESCARQEKHLERICEQKPCPTWELGNRTACSVTCGTGKRYREYLCHIENRIVPNSYCGNAPSRIVEDCNAGPCERYQWHTGNWSLCSVTCGEGTKRRKVICKSSDGIFSNKCSPASKPRDVAVCSTKPCPAVVSGTPIKYSSDPPHDVHFQQDNEIHDIIFHSGYEWRAGSYKECSRPCIKGYMHVEVKCISTETRTLAPDRYCDRREKPLTMIPCNRHRCPMWNTGDWSQCKGECGAGLQQRQVSCQSPSGKILPDDKCHDSKRPETVRLCWKAPCANNAADQKNRPETNILRKWTVSNWTACSKSCGSGLQRRRVECTIRRGNHGPEVTVKDEQCLRLGLNKPRSQRPCRRIACDYIWQEGPWSECSTECGDGIQRRSVTCHRINRFGLIDPRPGNDCPMDQKPTEEQSCILRECDDKYYWTAGPWKKCSHTCGHKGRQTRRLFCHDRTGKKVARLNCPKKYKPQRKRKCNQRKCYPMSCLEAKRYYNTSKDNEYTLLVGGRSMAIYCHEMASSEPKEYLTLPTGPRENYAEMYDKSLRNPQTCPYNGQRNESCECTVDFSSISGRTSFARVRLDPVNLYILENDYTFSRTKGAKRVEYGMAGDCYSLVSCPQGRFSINLTGTQFRLSSDVVWARTPGSSMKIDNISNQHVIGKCGGYCGSCSVSPKTGLKLDVLPP